MKTKQQQDLLNGKLLSYSAAAGAVFALGQNADAQVAYADVDPDVLLFADVGTRDSLNIDFNNDDIVDVTILHGNGDWYDEASYFFRSARAINGSGAEIAIGLSYASSFAKSYYFGLRFDKDAEIGPDLSWYFGEYQLGWWGWSTSTANTKVAGPWTDGEVDKYLGVRFSLDEGATYNYGWVRLDVHLNQDSISVKDYAYEETAGQSIKAGQLPTGIKSSNNVSDAKMFSFGKSIIISELARGDGRVEIFNVTGQLVHSTPVSMGRTEIHMENSGLYIVNLKIDNEIISRKVLVK